MAGFITGFADELEKLGTVTKAVKQYRRAVKLLESQGSAFHGTKAGKSIATSGSIKPSTAGRFGEGVYMWRGAPRPPYMNRRSPEGFATSLERADRGAVRNLTEAGTKRPATATDRGQILLYRGRGGKGAEPYPLKPKDTAILGHSQELHRGRQAHHLRHIHPEIFQRAKADVRARGLSKTMKYDLDPENIVEPSAKELRRLMRGQSSTPPLRPGADEFVEDYLASIVK